MYQRIRRYLYTGVIRDRDVVSLELNGRWHIAMLKDRSLFHLLIDVESGEFKLDGILPRYDALYFPTEYEILYIQLFSEYYKTIEKHKTLYKRKLILMNYSKIIVAIVSFLLIACIGGFIAYAMGGYNALSIYSILALLSMLFLFFYNDEK